MSAHLATLRNVAPFGNMICSALLCDISRMDDEPDLDTAAGRLKWARTRAGYETAEDFANKLKIKPVTYRAYEIGQNGYSRHAALFAKRLGVTTEWLLTGGAVPEHPRSEEQPSELQSLLRTSYPVS